MYRARSSSVGGIASPSVPESCFHSAFSSVDILLHTKKETALFPRSASVPSLVSLLTISTTGAISSRISLPLGQSGIGNLRPADLFGPVPDCVQFPREEAPSGTRYCPELDAFVPAHISYRIRGIKKARPELARDFAGWCKWAAYRVGVKGGHTWLTRRWMYEPLVMAMGLSHVDLVLIGLKEARRRPDIVYRAIAHFELYP